LRFTALPEASVPWKLAVACWTPFLLLSSMPNQAVRIDYDPATVAPGGSLQLVSIHSISWQRHQVDWTGCGFGFPAGASIFDREHESNVELGVGGARQLR
jgi:hypothetical protein